MVDFVESFDPEPVATLRASRHISANEHVFDGHFPGHHVWPGSLTIEGMGQTSALLATILGIWRVAASEGTGGEAALDALRNLQRGFEMHPGFRQESAEYLMSRLGALSSALSVGAAIDVKFHRPVFAGQRLDYRVALGGEFGELTRFNVEARVEEFVVASGTITGARVMRPVSSLMPPR
jgi:3-hydroxyacyl-[acyl-carrier-protein] dehydratase